jgi:glycosyltransferase involved in cell wall biosynthesis
MSQYKANTVYTGKPTVLFLASFFPTRLHPVKGPFIRNFADVVGSSYPLVVLTAEADAEIPGFWRVERSEDPNFIQFTVFYNHQRVRIPVVRSIVNFISFFSGTANAYRLIQKTHGPIGIHHLHSTLPMGLFVLWLKWTRGVRYVLSEQVTIYIYERFAKLNSLQKLLHKSIFRGASRVSALTAYHAEEIAKCGLRHDTMVIPNVIDEQFYGPGKRIEKDSTIKLIHISTLSPVKGVDDIVRAMAMLRNSGLDVSLTVIGGDEKRITELQKLAEHEGVSSMIDWKGWLGRETFVPLLQQADYFVLNSAFETFCVVAAEALACGLPVICPDLNPLKEFIDDKNGVFFLERTPKAIAKAVQVCVSNEGMFDRISIARKVNFEFGPNQVLAKFETLYEEFQL